MRTLLEIQEVINTISADYKVVSSKKLNANCYEYKMQDGGYLYFTPYDSNKTIYYGIWSHGYSAS